MHRSVNHAKTIVNIIITRTQYSVVSTHAQYARQPQKQCGPCGRLGSFRDGVFFWDVVFKDISSNHGMAS